MGEVHTIEAVMEQDQRAREAAIAVQKQIRNKA